MVYHIHKDRVPLNQMVSFLPLTSSLRFLLSLSISEKKIFHCKELNRIYFVYLGHSVSVHSAMLYRLPESNVRKSTCLEASLEEHKSAVTHGWLDMHGCDG